MRELRSLHVAALQMPSSRLRQLTLDPIGLQAMHIIAFIFAEQRSRCNRARSTYVTPLKHRSTTAIITMVRSCNERNATRTITFQSS